MSGVKTFERTVDLGETWQAVEFTLLPDGSRLVLVKLTHKSAWELAHTAQPKTLNARFDIDKKIFIDEPFDKISAAHRQLVADAIYALQHPEEDLIERTKNLLCAPHLELICKCAGIGNCGGCKVMKIAREWTKVFGARPCSHPQTITVGWVENPVQQCTECREIVR